MGATLRQYFAAIACSLSVTMMSACFNWMEPLMQYFISAESEIPMDTSDTSWLLSIVELGEVIMTVPAGILADRFGRKIVVLSTGPMALLSWVLILLTRDKTVLYIVRVIQGAGIATVYAVAPMYIAEISEPRIRGQLSGQFQTMSSIGVLFTYVTGHYLNYQNYAYACCAIPVFFIAFFWMMPESPYYQLMQDRQKVAMKSLKWLRAKKLVDEEFKTIKESVEEDMKSKGGWRDLFATKKDKKSFIIVQTMCCIKYLNGMSVIVTYATHIFAQASNGAINDIDLTIGFGVILVVVPFCSAFISDSVGRRPLLIFSTLTSAIFNTITGTYYFLIQQGYDVTDYYWVVFVSVSALCIVNNIGLGPLMQTIQAEYFPTHTRGIGGGITGLTASIAVFINLKQYQTVIDIIGVYMNFWIFAIINIFGTIFLYFVVPETAGRSLGQIQQDLQSKVDGGDDVITEGSLKCND